ncbi:LruC domain-containing protein [Mucilaginibacter sp. UR6-11]|uniref:LruC domain-containing protein n=1 Tax=Mucilaginibacter sp. UR6-11 TaxID=1435644 RepID=UPI001E41102A|nr:LruC domain-containing protein [Mucilaginibacter sp. UR6-11]MCC8424715.1 LruC domain-containing protein [Mucilaginibacter sp. UR6-11]
MKRLFPFLFLVGLFILVSCKKENSPNKQTDLNVAKIAPDGFNFSTSQTVNLNVTLRTNNDQPLAGVVVSVYAPDKVDSGDPLFKGVTNAAGNLTVAVAVQAYYSTLVIDPAYVGLLRNATAKINNGTISVVIGGKDGYSGDIVADVINNKVEITPGNGSIKSNSLFGTEIGYPTGYTALNAFTSPTNLGRPTYLEAASDVIDASLLSYINASLPEGKPLATTHPDYLNNKVNTINLTTKTDVWVTYVSEGAGYQNTLAYYTYSTSNPPSRSSGGTLFDGIDKITYIFPNASGSGSGGGLKSGDKVKLGTFDAGTTVAFVLLQNAWTGYGVTTSAPKFYSQNEFNPETSSALRQHEVMLYDDVHKVYVMGFEDQNRTSSDNDFNDLVVYATANPITAINNTNVAMIDKGGDTDGDGVQDEQDAFPNDATKAYINYYPSKDTYANIAFEDNWPKKGDLDLNDMVVQYRYSFVSNAKNQVVSMTGDYAVAAAGASFKNGFGVQLPVAASAVQSVSGYKLSAGSYITLASNGVEAGQSKAVIVPFDNHDLMVHNFDYAFFINTLNSKEKVTGQTASVTVNFTSPVDASTLKVSAFNPFLISNLRRGYEVHLPGFAPTDKADSKLFGTDDDKTSVATGKYYLSADNQPWAINFTDSFIYPIETANINQAYLHFADWARSGGTSYTDWYSSTAAGYRNTSNLYLK